MQAARTVAEHLWETSPLENPIGNTRKSILNIIQEMADACSADCTSLKKVVT